MSLTAMLQASFNVNQPSIQVPVITNRWMVGFFFLIHILIASFTMGALVIGPTFEWIGVRREDPRFERYARTLGNVNQKIFAIGATFGAFVVIVLIGLYGKLVVTLFTLFFWPLVVAFSIWFITIATLYTYNLRWERMWNRKGFHIALGYAAAAAEHIFLFIIVAVDSYMLTPGSGAKAFFNASYWPELGHRFVGNLTWASFSIAAVAAVYAAISRHPANRVYFHWAARTSAVIAFVTLIIQAVLGFVFAESIKHASPGAFQYSFQGSYAWLWLVQTALIAILLIGTNVYFAQSRPTLVGPVLTGIVTIAAIISALPAAVYPRSVFWLRYIALTIALLASLIHWLVSRPRARLAHELRRAGHVTLAVTGVAALVLFLTMGIIRETARNNYTIYGVLTQNDSYGIFQAPSRGYYP
jgi:cytochrome bd-type quinol oxidase subunit 1